MQRDPGYTGAAQVTIPGDGPPAPIQIELRRRVVVSPESELLSQLFPADHATNKAPGDAAAASGNPKPAPSDPDNPLNLSDDTITKLFNTGKAMAIVASLSKMDFAWNRQTPNTVQALEGVIRGAQGSGADPFGGGDLRVGVSDGRVRIFSVGPDGKWDGGKLARSDDPQLLGDLGAESDLNWISRIRSSGSTTLRSRNISPADAPPMSWPNTARTPRRRRPGREGQLRAAGGWIECGLGVGNQQWRGDGGRNHWRAALYSQYGGLRHSGAKSLLAGRR